MIRLQDWEQRLHDYLAAHVDAVFQYGTVDCALFGAGAVLAQTGEDPAARFRGRYRSRAGSIRALRRYGAGTLEATIDAALPSRGVAFARRGDLALVDGMVGVCLVQDAVFVGEEDGAPGLVRFPRSAWTRCWGVG